MLLFLFLYKILILFNSCSDVQIYIPTEEPVILTGIQTHEANAEIETQPVTVETRINKCST